MRTLRNTQYTPRTHWTQWNVKDEDTYYEGDNAHSQGVDPTFRFLNYHQPWEHPAISELAQQSRATNADLDYDSDSFLESLLVKLWLPDIHEREDDDSLSETLKTLAEVAYKASIDKQQAYKDYQEAFDKNTYLIYKEQQEAPPLDENASLMEKLSDPSPTARRIVDTYIELDEKYQDVFNKIFPKVLLEMVRNNYAPLEDNAYEYGANMSYKKDYDLLGKDYFYQSSVQDKLYHLNIATYPGENLPSYVHDQLVFMNYIQHTVVHEKETEQELAQSFDLLSDDQETVLTAFTTAIEGVHSWWTWVCYAHLHHWRLNYMSNPQGNPGK